jgi:chromosome segregation ATPase
MDFSKFDLLETKVSALIAKVTESESVKAELSSKLAEAEKTTDELKKKLDTANDSLSKARDELTKVKNDNMALSEIQESAKSKIEDLIKDRQVALSRVETLLEKLGSWS